VTDLLDSMHPPSLDVPRGREVELQRLSELVNTAAAECDLGGRVVIMGAATA